MPRVKGEADQANVTIKLKKSLNGRNQKHILTAKSLKLNKIDDTTVQPDNLQTQGKIRAIEYLVEVCK